MNDALKSQALEAVKDEKTCPLCGHVRIKPRSNNQNAYYWKCIVEPIANEIGENSNEVHGMLKEKFLSPQFIMIDGEDFPLPKSTTKLDTIGQENYHRDIRIWAQSFLNMTLQLPNQPIYE